MIRMPSHAFMYGAAKLLPVSVRGSNWGTIGGWWYQESRILRFAELLHWLCAVLWITTSLELHAEQHGRFPTTVANYLLWKIYILSVAVAGMKTKSLYILICPCLHFCTLIIFTWNAKLNVRPRWLCFPLNWYLTADFRLRYDGIILKNASNYYPR